MEWLLPQKSQVPNQRQFSIQKATVLKTHLMQTLIKCKIDPELYDINDISKEKVDHCLDLALECMMKTIKEYNSLILNLIQKDKINQFSALDL